VPPQAESKDQPPPDSGTEGPGKEILARECGSCHPLQVVESKRYDSRDAYATLVQRQVAMGAAVGQAEIPVLVDYLWRKYGLRYK
jgi:hypothetical protein